VESRLAKNPSFFKNNNIAKPETKRQIAERDASNIKNNNKVLPPVD
jgi:hypothetical protein